jgi:hypothetical protein
MAWPPTPPWWTVDRIRDLGPVERHNGNRPVRLMAGRHGSQATRQPPARQDGLL